MYGMNKTTVYLPDDLKQALHRTAAASGRSEAELIREGVKIAVEAGMDGVTLGHYDGATFPILRSVRDGLTAAGVKG